MGNLLRHIASQLPTVVMLMVIGTALLIGLRPSAAADPVSRVDHDKGRLLATLPQLTDIACDQNGLYLYHQDTPLMVVWIQSQPAALYGADGEFVAHLASHEIQALRSATRPLMDQCLGGPERPTASATQPI